jgi:hypothetical protein
MNNWCICWFSRIFLLGIIICKGLTARRIYKSFGVKGLNSFRLGCNDLSVRGKEQRNRSVFLKSQRMHKCSMLAEHRIYFNFKLRGT